MVAAHPEPLALRGAALLHLPTGSLRVQGPDLAVGTLGMGVGTQIMFVVVAVQRSPECVKAQNVLKQL